MGKISALLLLAFMALSNIQAQNGPPANVGPYHGDDIVAPPPALEEITEETVFKVVEEMPEFPGGQGQLMAYLASIQYPANALKNKDQGRAYILFIIEQDGSISNVVVNKSSGFEELDEAALKHVSAMPNWKPGTQRGKPVRVQFIVPIVFKLA